MAASADKKKQAEAGMGTHRDRPADAEVTQAGVVIREKGCGSFGR